MGLEGGDSRGWGGSTKELPHSPREAFAPLPLATGRSMLQYHFSFYHNLPECTATAAI